MNRTAARAANLVDSGDSDVTRDEDAMLDLLLVTAAQLGDYPLPEQPPRLEYRTHAWLRERACEPETPCHVVALYEDHAQVIYVDQRLRDDPSPLARSVLLHELVHYLQDRAGRHDGDCEQRRAREREAYRLQLAYLASQGLHGVLHESTEPCPALAAARLPRPRD